MTDMNDIKGALLSTLGNVAGKTREFAEKAADKAKDFTRITKLNMEISAQKDTIQKAYCEIGKLYYEAHKNSLDNFCLQLCDEVDLAKENIEKIQIEIDSLKAGDESAKNFDVEVEFTQVEEEPVKEETPAE